MPILMSLELGYLEVLESVLVSEHECKNLVHSDSNLNQC